MTIEKGERILFNGDSITDAGRDRNGLYSLSGYNKMIADTIDGTRPDAGVSCYNRGISGDRTTDLLARLEGELREIKPTMFSLLIGINDVWRKYDCNDPTPHSVYAKNMDAIFSTVKAYTDKIVILEPFLVATESAKLAYYEDLMPKIVLLRALSAKYRALYIPLDGLLAAASVENGAALYSPDGIHLAEAGNRLVADAFLSRVRV